MRFFKSGSLLSGSAVYLISNICNAAIPFALLPILTRYLTQEEYGQVVMFQTLLGALGAFVGVNVAGAASRRYYDNTAQDHNKELREYITVCLLILIISTFICTAILSLFSELLTKWLAVPWEWVLIAVVVSACTVIIQLRLGQWQARKQAIKFGTLQIAQSSLNLILSLFLVVWANRGGEGRVEAQMISSIIFACVALILLLKENLLFSLRNWLSHGRDALRFGIPLIPHVAGWFLLVSVDRFVINQQLGLASAGIYMVAVQLSMSMNLIFDALNKAYVPWLFERLRRDSFAENRKIVQITYCWYCVVFILVVLLYVLGPYIVDLVAGESYGEAGEVIGVIAIGQGFTGLYFMVSNYIFYSRGTGYLSVVTISSGILNVILLIVLVPYIGLKGAALAFCIANSIRFFLAWWVAQKKHPMPWLRFL